ncbi:MAG TPA: tetratricopeptide repeat protein [Phycisphaerae bacterium]|nr:tetratricopeptide repeat protein [Phycisphaerae bacterium]
MTQTTVHEALLAAIRYQNAGKFQEAEAIYRKILAQNPNQPDAMHFLGVLANQVGKPQVAADLIGRAISLRPNVAEYHNNMGVALAELGRFDEAIKHYHTAVNLKPMYPEVRNNLGNALREKGLLAEAVREFQAAIHFKSDYPEPYNNMGNAYKDLHRINEAIEAYRSAIRCKPEYAQAHNNLGNIFRDQGKLDEATEEYRIALKFRPDLAQIQANLGNVLRDRGKLDEAIAIYRAALERNPSLIQIHSNILYNMHFHPGYDAKRLYDEHVSWRKRHAEAFKQSIRPYTNNRDPERRLKIGYVSPDFRQHVVGANLLPLLQKHDRKNFEIICYSDVVNPDSLTARIRLLIDNWRNVVGVSDQDVTEMIRRDQIDILVDLTLHMANSRLPVFARKPAPVQVTYLGYCSTTGLDTIDYRLSDPYLDPPGTDLSVYTEKTIRLPRTYWCYQPGSMAPQEEEPPVVQTGYITFGCLNNFAKVSPEAMDLWAQIMNALPGSRLILHANSGSHLAEVRERFTHTGLAGERIEFVGVRPWPRYVATYNLIDITLDPFPYGGGITTCDSLFMGTPVVSLSGQTAVGRGGRSLLTNIGLPDLVAQTPEEYKQIVLKLAGDLPRLKELRRTLRQRMMASPLMDAASFARDVEAAYRAMWRNWCAKA